MNLARSSGRKYLPVYRKFFDDTSWIHPGIEDDKTQLRDMALVAAILVTDQKPKDYGYTIVVSEKPEHRYADFNYRFTEGKGKSMDDLRKAAFAKWAEWEKANLKAGDKK